MPTHYNVKMKMLYALAICGLVRRDDLAIFSETMNAGSHDIMDLISAGFVKESSAEVDIRIGGRSRKRVRRVCCITNKGFDIFLLFPAAQDVGIVSTCEIPMFVVYCMVGNIQIHRRRCEANV